MPTNHELRSIQKRMLALLLKVRQDPSRLDEIIEQYCIEMEQEDVAYVEKKIDKR